MLAALLLSACQVQTITLTPPPAPETWQVETTPALRWLGPVFQRCTIGLPGANLLIHERPAAQLGGPQVDFSFQWGDRAAARFSFLMSIPVMLAAGALELKDVFQTPGLTDLLPAILLGFLAAAVVGYFSIRWLLNFVITHSLRAFSVYCAALGVLVVFIYVVFPR